MPILKENCNFSYNCVFLDFQQIFEEIWEWICEWSEVNNVFSAFQVTRLVVPKLVRFIILLLFTFNCGWPNLPSPPPGWHRVNWCAKICPPGSQWLLFGNFQHFLATYLWGKPVDGGRNGSCIGGRLIHR